MTAIVTRGDAGNLHLPDETVDLIVTSPPYFGLRSYQDTCDMCRDVESLGKDPREGIFEGGYDLHVKRFHHYEGQIGDEATPTEYLDALMACTAEWMRVLKPGGSIFVNLGDKYAADNRGSGGDKKRGEAKWAPAGRAGYAGEGFVRQKSLMLLPQRYAIRCIDELGLILRAEIVWAKPNGLPESVTDRVRRSHEQVFHFVKQPRYYSAVDEIREGYAPGTLGQYARSGLTSSIGNQDHPSKRRGILPGGENVDSWTGNPLGKLPGSVWTIPTAPLKVPASLGIDHFAAYPPELVRRIVLGWSPREVCTACGEGRRPVTSRIDGDGRARRTTAAKDPSWQAINRADWQENVRRIITGYACLCTSGTHLERGGCGDLGDSDEADLITCGRCIRIREGLPTTDAPGVVLDPFGGTGTTALVATMHGRVGISVDLSADYCRLAQWRTTDPGERARVLGVDKPPVQVDGQLGMFEGLSA